MARMETADQRCRKMKLLARLEDMWKLKVEPYPPNSELTFKVVGPKGGVVAVGFLTSRACAFADYPDYFLADRKLAAMKREAEFLGVQATWILHCARGNTLHMAGMKRVLRDGVPKIINRVKPRSHGGSVAEDLEAGRTLPREHFADPGVVR